MKKKKEKEIESLISFDGSFVETHKDVRVNILATYNCSYNC